MATKNAINSNIPIEVTKGGTGSATLTDHGVLVGSGTSPIDALAVGTNGQVLLGSTGVDPVFATLTSSDGSITFTPGAGSLSLQAVAGANTIVTTFSMNGTWNKNANTKYITVYGWAGGSGGASGRKGVTALAGGGGGGCGGNAFVYSAPATYFNASETVTIGTGGAGGAAQAVNNNNGTQGGLGTPTTFGSITATNTVLTGVNNTTGAITTINGRGSPGVAGTTTLTTIGTIFTNAGSDAVYNNTAGQGTITAGTFGTSTAYVPVMLGGSGGGGGGADIAVERAGGTGGAIYQMDGTVLAAGGVGGLESTGINGSNGTAGIFAGGIMTGGAGGGGGGGYSVGAGGATTGGIGGNGGFPGGGGGGGGGGINAVANSGRGGAGADGFVIVIEYL